MDSFLAYCSFCCILILGTDGVTLTFEMKNIMPLKGSSVEFSCLMLNFNSGNLKILNGNSALVTSCSGTSYNCNFCQSGCMFTANISGAFGVISNLKEDEGTWRCSYLIAGAPEVFSNNLKVIMYSIPSGLSITQNPNQAVDLSVNSVEFKCKTMGCTYPKPTVLWIFKDQEYISPIINMIEIRDTCTGQEMVYTNILQIQQYTAFNDNSDKTGNFYCRIEYPDPSRSIISNVSHSVTFAVHVTSITLDPPGEQITVLDRNETSFRCTTGPSRPKPDIRWWLDVNEVTNQTNTTVTGDGNLFIAFSVFHLIIDRSHQGKKVYCNARVTGQINATESAKRTINVWYQPTIPSVQSVQGNFPWLENRTGTLQCVMADPGNPNASVKWTSSRGIMEMDGNLVFKNLSANDHGQPVYCQVQNNFTDIKGLTVVSPTVSLNVEYRPTITTNSSVQPLRIKEGSTLTVICLASGNPLPMVQWTNRNPPSNALIIPNILRNNTGSYTCLASNTSTNYNHVLLQREESMTVIVEYAPDVRVNISRSMLVGSTTVLMCTAQGEPPQYTFHPWIHWVGQTEIRSLNGVNTDSISILTLSNISIQDIGLYICNVSNSITGLDGQLYQKGKTSVNILGPPAFGEIDSKIIGEAGKPKTIEIPFYSSSSKTKVMFIKQLDSFEMSNTSNVSIYTSSSNVTLTFYTKKEIILGHVAILFFGNVTERDFDNYTLQLSNDMGNVTMVFVFIASGPPSTPKQFFFINIKDGFLVFGIEKGHNGGHDQTFVVEYRPSGNSEPNWTTVLKINETNLEQSSTDRVYHIKIPKLQDGMYTFRVYAENVKGTSSAFENVYADIKAEQQSAVNLPVPAITGGVIGAIVLVIAIVVVVLVVKRRSQGPGKKDFEEIHRDSNNGTQDSELKLNPIYDSSNPEPLAPVDAAVTKPKKPIAQNDDSNVYAQVDKSKGNKSKANKIKKKPVKASKAPKGKPVKASRGDIYENSPLPLKNPEEFAYENPGLVASDPSESVYENPGPSAPKGHLADKDGLQYAVLKLGPPTTKGGKPVIHGLENRTEYAEIAYGKRGEPLPDSDEEKKDGAK